MWTYRTARHPITDTDDDSDLHAWRETLTTDGWQAWLGAPTYAEINGAWHEIWALRRWQGRGSTRPASRAQTAPGRPPEAALPTGELGPAVSLHEQERRGESDGAGRG